MFFKKASPRTVTTISSSAWLTSRREIVRTVVLRSQSAARKAGVPIETVSVGSTPTARFGFAHPGITEARPGNYVYLDRTQAGMTAPAKGLCLVQVFY